MKAILARESGSISTCQYLMLKDKAENTVAPGKGFKDFLDSRNGISINMCLSIGFSQIHAEPGVSSSPGDITLLYNFHSEAF